MTGLLACSCYAQLTGHPFEIPRFIVDSFTTCVTIAVGATAAGGGIGIAAAAIKAFGKRKNDDDSDS